MHKFALASAAAACAVAASAHADGVSASPYARFAGGLNLADYGADGEASLTDSYLGYTIEGTASDVEVDFEAGFIVSAALGVAIGDFRAEGELAYRLDRADELSFAYDAQVIGGPGTTLSGRETVPLDEEFAGVFSIMANGWWDAPLRGPVTPFVGGGVGMARVDFEPESSGGDSASDFAFAWQAGAGARLDITDHAAVTAEYRYFAIPDVGLLGDAGFRGVSDEYTSSSLMVGFLATF